MLGTSVSTQSADSKNTCSKCGDRLRRLGRRGFLQNGVYPLFGYYPWECFTCCSTEILRKRGRKTSRLTSGHSTSEEHDLFRSAQQESTPPVKNETTISAKTEVPASPIAVMPPMELSAPPTAELPAATLLESLPQVPVIDQSSRAEESETDASRADGSIPFSVAAPIVQENESRHLLEDEASESPKSGPLRSRKAEILYAPKRASMRFRKRSASQSADALPPISEAAIRRALFVADVSPDLAAVPGGLDR
jgi:hypothetical protein